MTKKEKIGIIFKSICYDIDDIDDIVRVWYYDDQINFILYSDTGNSPYKINMKKEKAEKNINYINNFKYQKIIKFNE